MATPPPAKRARVVTAPDATAVDEPSMPVKMPRTRVGSSLLEPLRTEFTLGHLTRAARDSARCISVSLDVDRLFRDARVVYLTADKASWVYHVPKWFRRVYTHCHAERELTLPYADWFQRVWALHPTHHDTIKMFGKDVPTPRFQQMFGDVDYRFSGATFVAKPLPAELDLVTRLLRACVTSPATGETYLTSLLVNWFANGDHYIGPHSDAEGQLHANAPIFSLSLGATRRFVMTPRKEAPPQLSPKKLEFSLDDGDLLVMGGTTQKTHKHAVPKMKKAAGKRISVTMRCYK